MSLFSKNVNIFFNGLGTGMLLQLAIGPVFFFIANLSLQKTVIDGLAGVAAVTLVDYLYIILAILGIGKFIQKPRVKKIFNVVGPLILIIFGIITFKSALVSVDKELVSILPSSPWTSFLAAFLLTISNPMGIIFWTGLFASKVTELNYTKSQLGIFGFATGLATFLFMGAAVIILSGFGSQIPMSAVRGLNILVGALLVYYGINRLVKNHLSERLN